MEVLTFYEGAGTSAPGLSTRDVKKGLHTPGSVPDCVEFVLDLLPNKEGRKPYFWVEGGFRRGIEEDG